MKSCTMNKEDSPTRQQVLQLMMTRTKKNFLIFMLIFIMIY